MATLRDVAARTQLPVTTVGRILRGENKEVWPSAVQRAEHVRQVARELGYRPNGSARAVRVGRFSAVGLVSRSTQGLLNYNLLKGVHRELSRRDLHSIYAEVAPEHDDRLKDPRVLRELSVDGLIVHLAAEIAPSTIDAVRRMKSPVVWVNTKQMQDCVHPDDLGGARRATQRLIGLGHTRIVLAGVDGSNGHYSQRDRIAGYASAMIDAGLTPRHAPPFVGEALEDRVAAAAEWLGQGDRPTAVIGTDIRDIHALRIAAICRGIRVPGDLSLVVFHDQRQGPVGREFSVMWIPMITVGVEAVRMLMDKLKRPEQGIVTRAVAYDEPEDQTISRPQ